MGFSCVVPCVFFATFLVLPLCVDDFGCQLFINLALYINLLSQLSTVPIGVSPVPNLTNATLIPYTTTNLEKVMFLPALTILVGSFHWWQTSHDGKGATKHPPSYVSTNSNVTLFLFFSL